MTTTLTKADIVDEIYEDVDLNRYEIKKAVETLLQTMKDAVKRDHSLLVSGFGKFDAYDKKARRGRNPATNETLILEPRRVVVFRVSRKLRDAINNTDNDDPSFSKARALAEMAYRATHQ